MNFFKSREQKFNFEFIFSAIFFLFFIGTGLKEVRAEESQKMFEQANSLLKEGRVDDAISIYKNIKHENNSSVFYFNFGNAWFRNHDYGRAILNYRKALFLNPRDSDARMNLKYARAKIKDRLDYGERSNPLLKIFDIIDYFSLNEIYRFFCFSVFLTMFLFFIYRFTRRRFLNQVLSLVLFLTFLTTTGFLYKYYWWKKVKQGVVLKNITPVRAGPGIHFNESLSPLNSGAEIVIEEESAGWYKIKVFTVGSSGREVKQGYIARESVGII
ncbi:hypothetical protein ACFL35_16415 [Candidatus Riflebacteria bacterium]